MRQVYRVAGADLDAASLRGGHHAQPLRAAARGLGRDLPRSSSASRCRPTPTLFDRDESALSPRAGSRGRDQVVQRVATSSSRTSQPFADPTQALRPARASDSLYRTPLYLLLTQGPPAKFAVAAAVQRHRAAATAPPSTSTPCRSATDSEQLYVGGRKLVRGVDYTISYDVGQVTFLNPDALFGQGIGPGARRASRSAGSSPWRPTTILGMSTRYSLGRSGRDQPDRASTSRSRAPSPARRSGSRPAANLIGGVNTELHFRPSGITRFLNSLTSSPATAPSAARRQRRVRLHQAGPEPVGRGVPGGVRGRGGAAGVAARDAVGVRQRAAGARRPGGHRLRRRLSTRPTRSQLTWQNLVPELPGTDRPSSSGRRTSTR